MLFESDSACAVEVVFGCTHLHCYCKTLQYFDTVIADDVNAGTFNYIYTATLKIYHDANFYRSIGFFNIARWLTIVADIDTDIYRQGVVQLADQ